MQEGYVEGSAKRVKSKLLLMGLASVLVVSIMAAPSVALAKNRGAEKTCEDTCSGTKYSDQLTGTDTDTTFYARAGNDKIDDRANPQQGGDVDTVFAGGDNDSINVDDGDNTDSVDCGKGNNDTVVADPQDEVLENCEHVTRS